MSDVARHRLNLTLRGALIAGILAALVALMVPSAGSGPALAQQAPPEAMSPDDYSAVQDLRRRLSLSNDDLAAVGCSQQQAEAVLGALKAWYESNKATLQQADADVRAAERELRDTMRLVHVGPRDEAVLARVGPQRRTVESAQTAKAQAIDQAIGQLSTAMGGEPASRWQAILANRTGPPSYRYLTGLSDQQVESLNHQLAKRTRRGQTVSQVESQVLSVSQQAALQELRQRARANIEGVLAAEASVLPAPLELGDGGPSPSQEP